jgi:hypothetical protein
MSFQIEPQKNQTVLVPSLHVPNSELPIVALLTDLLTGIQSSRIIKKQASFEVSARL